VQVLLKSPPCCRCFCCTSIGCACCCCCNDIIVGGVPTPTSNWPCVIKCKIKPPCHSHGGCRNTWQYDTYYQHCWWESFVRTYGEAKGGCRTPRCNSREIKLPGFDEILKMQQPGNKVTGIRRDCLLQWRLTGDFFFLRLFRRCPL